jgi:glycosyltransferase involved in cell wall biosynthesis
VAQLADHLKGRGYDVRFDLRGEVDVIVLVDPRTDATKAFGYADLAAYRRRHPGVRVLHRINECDQRKGTRFMDDLLRQANTHADFTVFISRWLRDYHAERWFDTARPHRVIYNGADPRVFHPVGGATLDDGGPLRLVTHHWSRHPLKGFDVYEQVDRWIAARELPGVELWVIGRWPEEVVWRSARTWPPTHGVELARKLRACHAYLTASRWEPGGMHHVEGAQCGLPVLYHEDGGGIVDGAERYGLAYADDVRAAIARLRIEYRELRRRVLERMPSGDRMCLEFAHTIQQLLCDRDEPAGAPAGVAAASGGEPA